MILRGYTTIHALLMSLGFLIAAVCAPSVSSADESILPVLSSSSTPTTDISGYFAGRYVYRSSHASNANTNDQDVFADLRLDLTRPRDNSFEFHLQGTARSDLDGDQDLRGFNPFEDIGDTWGRRTNAQLIEANAVLNDPLRYVTRLVVGRQSSPRDDPAFFDGITAQMGGEKLLFTLYGGAAVHFYEIDWKWGHDRVEGAGLDYRPLPSLGMSADVLFVKDSRDFDPASSPVNDRMVSFKIWQRFEPFTRFSAQYRYLDGEARDLTVNAAAAMPEQDAEIIVTYFRQFNPQAELSNELSPFYDVIGTSAPFQSIDVKVRKFIASGVALDAGYFKRDLLDDSDEGPFNKAYWRAFLDAEISDFLLANLSWTLTGERWETGTTSVDTYGTDLSYRVKKQGRESRLSAGTYYSLYKYDYYVDLGVRDHVRTYYVDGKYPLGKAFSMNGRYEYEASIERYQTVRVGMRYDF